MSTSTSSTSLVHVNKPDPELWDVDYINPDHISAFARALSISDNAPLEGDVSPVSPRSPPLPVEGDHSAPPTWKYGPDNGVLGGESSKDGRGSRGGRVEKLTATSDFAVRRE